MEDNIQTIIVVIVSVFLLFIFPVYMAYEKKDDISYALAMRYTQDLVDEVRDKGYISKYMYDDYRAKLKVTGNSYDIQLTHEYNRYDPIVKYYSVDEGKYTLVKTTTIEDKEKYEKAIIQSAMDIGVIPEDATTEEKNKYITDQYTAQGVDKVENTYELSKQVYTTNHIENVLNSERKLLLNSDSDDKSISCSDDPNSTDGCQYAYIMNVGDNFNITIKNTNTTLATVIYNMVTANTLDENTRIYVNYGGNILSSKWYESIDYAKMDHDRITLDKFTSIVIFTDEREYLSAESPNIIGAYKDGYTDTYSGEYAIEFDVKPNDVTILREKGDNNNSANPVDNYSGYNFAIGNRLRNNLKLSLSANVGINGISLVTHGTDKYNANAILNFLKYKKVVDTKEVSTKFEVQKQRVIEGTNGEEFIQEYYEEVSAIANLTNYKKIEVKASGTKNIIILLTGKNGTNDAKITVTSTSDFGNVLQNLNYTSNNPSNGMQVSGDLAGVTNNIAGQPSKYYITILQNNVVVKMEREQQLKITDYNKLTIQYVNKKIKFTLSGGGETTYSTSVDLVGETSLLDGYFKEITDFTRNYEINIGTPSLRGSNITGLIEITDTSVNVNAYKDVSREMTVLSYPVSIKDYATVKIEFRKNENEKYIATLYMNGEKIEDSIEMVAIPKVSVIGKTFIGTEERFFNGKIRNVIIYYYR